MCIETKQVGVGISVTKEIRVQSWNLYIYTQMYTYVHTILCSKIKRSNQITLPNTYLKSSNDRKFKLCVSVYFSLCVNACVYQFGVKISKGSMCSRMGLNFSICVLKMYNEFTFCEIHFIQIQNQRGRNFKNLNTIIFKYFTKYYTQIRNNPN